MNLLETALKTLRSFAEDTIKKLEEKESAETLKKVVNSDNEPNSIESILILANCDIEEMAV